MRNPKDERKMEILRKQLERIEIERERLQRRENFFYVIMISVVVVLLIWLISIIK